MTDPQTITIAPEERGLAAITHLSGLAGYILPLGGLLVPILIWIVKSDSRVISSIARQALLLNVMVWILGIVLIIPFFTVILIPLAIVGWIMLGLVALILPIVGALKASDGAYYRYPLVGPTQV
ncbi:MAG: DUF4870 domain-containing protein [Acidobacteriota bacterium]|jgi:uncharacterized Tic20 family protein